MTELLSSAQMRAIEAAAIGSGRVSGIDLMERAGRGVVEAIFDEWPELKAAPFRAVLLCGPGNNGGDGFVVARLLKEWGWQVEVYLYGDPARLPPDARTNHDRWCLVGEVRDYRDFRAARGRYEIVVDALFGIGMTRPMEVAAHHGEILAMCAPGRDAAHMVAIDVPTGLSADTGQCMEPYFHAALTVTFHAPKLGHYLAVGPDLCGKLRVVDIGLGTAYQGVARLAPSPADENGAMLAKGGGASFGNRRNAHKFTYGHALVMGGPSGHGGAARLAARGALRIGAGLVTLGCAGGALTENASRLDAIMVREIAEPYALQAMLEDKRIKSLCIGPGLGVSRAAGMLAIALAARPGNPGDDSAGGIVIDADGITALAQDSALFAKVHGNCVLTPHEGEFARLFPDIAARLESLPVGGSYSKVDAVREAAARAGCVVLFKGPDTVIADPSGKCIVNAAAYDRSAPWLATAGSGDVLAGFIAGLLARGFPPMQAAATAAWLHVEAARSFGPGLIAEDLPEALPDVFRQLGL